MPHLQDNTAQKKHRKDNTVGSGFGINSPSSGTEELPIQVATPNFLSASDPVVAMAKKVSATVVDSSFESVQQSDSGALSSSSPRLVAKNVITPTSSIGNNSNSSSDDGSATEAELESSQKASVDPILTAVSQITRLAHSPIIVKRRVSQTEGEETTPASKQQQGECEESPGPALIRRGSSLTLGNQSGYEKPCKEESSETISEIVKSKDSGNATKASSVAEESTMANMRKRKPVISPPTVEKKVDDSPSEIRQSPSLVQQPRHVLPGFHPGVVATPGFHPHPAAFAGHPFGPAGVYPMGYAAGYPPHPPTGGIPPFVGGQFHRHPVGGFYSPYPPHGFHPHPMQRHGPTFIPPYGHAMNTTLQGSKVNPTLSNTNSKEKNGKNNQMAVGPSSKTGVDGNSPSANRCVPLQEPIPSKHWGTPESAEGTTLPDFHKLVNYPDYLSKTRTVGSGDAGNSKAVGGKKHCVMCGKLRICSASSLTEKGRAAASGDDGTAHIIPRQNKGLCTACDVTVWVLVSESLEIKWCKGCKNFRCWAAFGEKGSATKCVRCRERQREKYAMQKSAKRARRSDKSEFVGKSEPSNQHNGSVEPKQDKHFAAARGLTSLMHAAAAL